MKSDTTMFRVRYIGEDANLRGKQGWGWTESRQPGLTFLKWFFAPDDEPEGKSYQVVAPLELEILRNWSRKKDGITSQVLGDTERSMQYALSMLADPYDLAEVRKLLGIPDLGQKEQPMVDMDSLFSAHDFAQEEMNERQARDLRHLQMRQEAMAKIDSVLGAPLGEEVEEEIEVPLLTPSGMSISLDDLFSVAPKKGVKKAKVPAPKQESMGISLDDLFGEPALKTEEKSISLAELFS